jgi:hypothetical protein
MPIVSNIVFEQDAPKAARPSICPAQTVYQSVGFTYCGPFAEYKLDPNSVFMTLEL